MQVVEQVLRIRGRNNDGRVLTQNSQKRLGNGFRRIGQPQENRRAVARPQTGQHLLREGAGLAEGQPAGALEVVGELASTRRGWV